MNKNAALPLDNRGKFYPELPDKDYLEQK